MCSGSIWQSHQPNQMRENGTQLILLRIADILLIKQWISTKGSEIPRNILVQLKLYPQELSLLTFIKNYFTSTA